MSWPTARGSAVPRHEQQRCIRRFGFGIIEEVVAYDFGAGKVECRHVAHELLSYMQRTYAVSNVSPVDDGSTCEKVPSCTKDRHRNIPMAILHICA